MAVRVRHRNVKCHLGVNIKIGQRELIQGLTWSEIHKFRNQIICEDKLKTKWQVINNVRNEIASLLLFFLKKKHMP